MNASARATSAGATADRIAVVGMRGRFPGANDLEQFWQNLADGVESIRFLSTDEMRAAGVPDTVTRLPGYVNASPILDNVDQFDAAFFGYSARDASLTDPQHRLFLESAYEALEDAAYDPSTYDGAIGVFGGCELSSYLYQLYLNLDSLGYFDGMQLMVTNDKDHLCTQVSYRLNLRGPSVVVQTTCSTSLVAVATACESLLAGHCDMALAGGVTVRVPQRGGYFYTAGSILSPDGHCRPFDASAQGTIVGSGVGIVVLKRLRDALADGDTIRAVILGAGLNNDGSAKAGYTAPSPHGQAAAIRAALASAGVSADTIGYVEAHGTGTILGDPIEFSALTDAFRDDTDRRGFCGIGSVKSNVGHLSCASGVTGLIKTILTMQHGAIPPTVHYTTPNPAIDFTSSPFYVATELLPWERNGKPRRAAVSSFGVGGTNAHVVLEEAPDRRRRNSRGKPRLHDVITLSARSESALDATTTRLGHHLRRHPELDLAEVAYTLHVGRQAFGHRRAFVVGADDADGAVARLATPEQLPAAVAAADRPVVFMFSGQGTQYPGMAAGLYRTERVLRDAVDNCARVLEPELGLDLRKLLFPPARRKRAAAETLQDTAFTQPALFTVEYALAELWKSWGVVPAAMIGHSIGEYVAATLSGVLELDDALSLVAQRGRLMSSLPSGSMLGVIAPAADVISYVNGEVSLAAVNGPTFSVLSGPHDAIGDVEQKLAAGSIATRRLRTSHAFHSSMMEPILHEFEDAVRARALSAPSVPYVCNLTGAWADEGVMRPEVWSAQLRSTVRFADGLHTLHNTNGRFATAPLFLEVGPGRTLVTFAAESANGREGTPSPIASLPGADDARPDSEVMLGTLAQMWTTGVAVDWVGYHRGETRHRVSLPTYPFERQTYWIGTPNVPTPQPAREARDVADWFLEPRWHEVPLPETESSLSGARVLVLDDATGVGAGVVDQLRANGAMPIVVRRGARYERVGEDAHVIDPSEPRDFARLATAATESDDRLAGVIDCWSAPSIGGLTDPATAAITSLLTPLRLATALTTRPTVRPLPMLLLARGTQCVIAGDVLDPARALGLGAARVVPQEHTGFRIAHVDVDDDEHVADMVVAELADGAREPALALRAGRRHVQTFAPCPIDDVGDLIDLPPEPVVLVTGGLGHMGLILSEALFRRFDARLALIGRSAFPEPEKWAAASESPTVSPDLRDRLQRLAAMHAVRPDVMVLAADVDSPEEVHTAIDRIMERFGRVDLVIHGAANIGAEAFGAVVDTGQAVVDAQLSPKIAGALNLERALAGREPQRWVMHSSISSVLGGLGLSAYAGANAVLDAMAARGGDKWLSILWDAWDNAGEAETAAMPHPIQPAEGQDAFLRLLSAPVGRQVVVAQADFDDRFEAWVRRADGASTAKPSGRHPRPNLASTFVEPSTETERTLAEIWSDHLGVEPVGVHDRFGDLGGHSLLAVQVASEIRDRFQIELPVLQLFQAPTVSELAVLVEATARGELAAPDADADADVVPVTAFAPADDTLDVDRPEDAAKAGYRDFYDDVTRRLDRSGVGDASFFLNYGYVSVDGDDEARVEVDAPGPNPSSVRLALELIGPTALEGRAVLDVGCGRGGTVGLVAAQFDVASATGVDLAPEAIAFCRRTHRHPACRFEVGDAEHLPVDDEAFDVVTNIESSHTYPDIRAFLTEVRRVLRPGGSFLYTDLLPAIRWAEVHVLLAQLGLDIASDRDITANVLASCDEVAATRAQAFGERDAMIENFLAVPGSAVYEQMDTRAWEYRIIRAHRTS